MTKWKTRQFLSHDKGTCRSECLRIKQGIFQGDSLSPLLFCMASIPLSSQLNNTDYGYGILEAKVCHLFYTDDLKLFAMNEFRNRWHKKRIHRQFAREMSEEIDEDLSWKWLVQSDLKVQTNSKVQTEATICAAQE